MIFVVLLYRCHSPALVRADSYKLCIFGLQDKLPDWNQYIPQELRVYMHRHKHTTLQLRCQVVELLGSDFLILPHTTLKHQSFNVTDTVLLCLKGIPGLVLS